MNVRKWLKQVVQDEGFNPSESHLETLLKKLTKWLGLENGIEPTLEELQEMDDTLFWDIVYEVLN